MEERTRRLAEARLRRELRAGELAVDVAQIIVDLEGGKERIRVAIDAEKRRAIRALVDGRGDPALHPTDRILTELVAVYETGRRHAAEEIVRLAPDARLADRELSVEIPARLHRVFSILGAALTRISTRVQREAALLDLTGVRARLLVELDRRVPGVLDAASRLVSPAFQTGVADIFQENQALFAGWMQSAILDGATCDPCDGADGTEFATWEEAMAQMPDGGPYPECDGDTRCRCRLVPLV